MSDATAKLVQLIKPALDEAVKAINQQTTISSQEILLQIQEVQARLTVLEQGMAAKKTSKPRTAKGAASPNDGAAPANDGQALNEGQAPAEAVEAAAAAGGKFPINKLHYFKQQYKDKSVFRERYTAIPALKAAIDGSVDIQKKTKPDQKLIAESQLAWNWLKVNKPDSIKEVEQEYDAAKAAHNTVNKGAQNAVEPDTPPNEPAK